MGACGVREVPDLFGALRDHALHRPDAIALDDGAGLTLAYGALEAEIEMRARSLRAMGARCVGILADNGPEWILADLAATLSGVAVVPLPLFFSPGQIAHVIRTAGVDAVLAPSALGLGRMAGQADFEVAPAPFPGELVALRRRDAHDGPHVRFDKITFTSGTTGAPKGVGLSLPAMLRVACSLAHVTGADASDVHLCLVPLSILLENVVGVYGALLVGARVVVPPLADVGIVGSSRLDAMKMHAALARTGATTAIAMPEMLAGLVGAIEAGAEPLARLRFLGVGGAHVPAAWLARAERAGVPAFEGYGLSECSSVVAVNTPDARRTGSVGRVLPHARVRIAPDGEILARGSVCSGYLTPEGLAPCDIDADGFLRTGDLGALDADGYLYVRGRKHRRILTSFGRNVSPDWIEAEILGDPRVRRVRVHGEGLPALEAEIACAARDEETVRAHVARVNAALPDYARIARWVRIEESA